MRRMRHTNIICKMAGLRWFLALMFAYMIATSFSFNGDDFELECPDECDCHYFRINWVTDCSESNLTEIPYSELSLNVYILDLNGNNITKLKPFPKDIKMRRLQIANNLLTSIDKNAFVGLDYLIDVDLSGNNISFVDPEAFVDSRGLLNVELQDNPIQDVEGPFLVSSTLQFLDISNCRMAVLNPQFFENITSLTTLDLSNNPLQYLDSGVFDPLTGLETLKLNDCKLTSISVDSFDYLSGLKTLELAGNYLTDSDWTEILGKLGRLENLNLRNSKIKSLAEDAFSNATYLVTLVLADNELRDLDVATTLGSSLQRLELLDLSNCNIQGSLTGEAFANATKLKTLYLSGNPLFADDLKEAIEPLPKLEKLFLRNCKLRRLPDVFNSFENLQELDISHNPLVNAFTKLLAPLDKLEYLNMGYSNLSYIGPETFSQMTSMKRLVLSGNDISSLEAGLFGNLTQLSSLELDFCGLKRPLNANVFFKNFTYTELREIKLAGNPLVISKTGPLFPKKLSRIVRLDLSNCNISELNAEAFTSTPNITDLNLSGNRLNSESGSLAFLDTLEELERINLSNNNLTTINPQIFINNPKIHSLNLVGNPFKCDCKIAEMWDWANMVKGDINVLVGAKSAAQDIIVKGNKKKKNLLCHYDKNQLKNMTILTNRTVPGRRPFIKPRELTASNRTWAKYVRESGCEPVVKILRPVALMGHVHVTDDANDLSSVSSATALLGGIVVMLGVGIASMTYRLKKTNCIDPERTRKYR